MIDVIITSYNEPKSTLRAVNTFLSNSNNDLRVTVVDPFPEVGKFLSSKIKDKRFVFFLDPGEGKSYALNLLFQEYWSNDKDDLFILTDGDVFVSKNAIQEISDAFRDINVGCVTGKPVSVDPRDTKYGYLSQLFFGGIDKTRKVLSEKEKFFECSGYLFAIRKGVIMDFPLETSEDSIIPFLFWEKGYKIRYLPKAEVYVKNPENFKDWTAQKIRNIKAHENLSNVAPNLPRTKSFFNEIRYGAVYALTFPKRLIEFKWTVEAYFMRLYIYFKAFKELRKKSYKDGWRETEIESTKPLD